MSAVQLEVRLVGDDPEQQKAFDRASSDAVTQANHSAPTPSGKPDLVRAELAPDPVARDLSVDAFVTALDEVLAAASKPKGDAHSTAFNSALDDVLGESDAKKASSDAFLKALDEVLSADKPRDTKGDSKPTGTREEHEAINSIDELIKKIDELIASDRVQKGPKKEKSDKEPETEFGKFFSNLDEAVNKKLEAFGMENTRAGRVVSNVSGAVKKYGTKIANSKVGKSIAGALGRSGATTAATAAGTEAATAVGGTALAGAAASAALPLTAVAVVAAGAALTLKGLSDAVQSAANELTDLSPELAAVRSQYQLTRELARLDRADRIGAGAAQLEAARSRISDSMYEVQTKILEIILKFAPLLEGVLDGVNVGVRGADTLIASMNVLVAFITSPTDFTDDKKAIAAAEKSAEALAKAFDKWVTTNTEPDVDRDPFLAELFNIPGNPPPMPRAPRAGGRP